MAISTYVGDTRRPWKFTLKYADGTVPPLAGATNSNFVIRITAGGTTVTGGGNWTVLDATNGIVAYQPLPGEVATATTNGQTQITFVSNGNDTFPPDGLTITTKL